MFLSYHCLFRVIKYINLIPPNTEFSNHNMEQKIRYPNLLDNKMKNGTI
jgi:hypothetical protein